MNIWNKLWSGDEADSIYEMIKSLKVSDIINSPDTIYGISHGSSIKIEIKDRKMIACGIKKLEADMNIEHEADETLAELVARASVSSMIDQYIELDSLRAQAEEINTKEINADQAIGIQNTAGRIDKETDK